MTESKTELLGWLNDLLQVNYSSIEQCGSGAAFCQILDSIHGSVPLSRVKFDSTAEYDYVSNFKILQSILNKHKIERNVPIDRLVKCRYSDNLEFLQWIKKYWDAFYPGGRYDAPAKRNNAKKIRPAAFPVQKSVNSSRAEILQSRTSATSRDEVDTTDSRIGSAKQDTARKKVAIDESDSSPHKTSATPRRSSMVGLTKSISQQRILDPILSQNTEKQIQELTRQVNELKSVADTLERERNFYYLKLRDLEVLVFDKLESPEQPALLSEIQAILYATEEGFIRPNRTSPPKRIQSAAGTTPRGESHVEVNPTIISVSIEKLADSLTNTAPIVKLHHSARSASQSGGPDTLKMPFAETGAINDTISFSEAISETGLKISDPSNLPAEQANSVFPTNQETVSQLATVETKKSAPPSKPATPKTRPSSVATQRPTTPSKTATPRSRPTSAVKEKAMDDASKAVTRSQVPSKLASRNASVQAAEPSVDSVGRKSAGSRITDIATEVVNATESMIVGDTVSVEKKDTSAEGLPPLPQQGSKPQLTPKQSKSESVEARNEFFSQAVIASDIDNGSN
ncbi:hypothetical protein HDU84_000158 [Entophlyctis sp. JEL0112]|nr:hypothetical protein HDU84_000158 [Entophlyctis sp. JEL0112]